MHQGPRKEKVAAHEVFQQKVAAKRVIFLFFSNTQIWVFIYHLTLLLQTTRRRYSNRAKLGPEQGTKQPIPPTFIKN